MLGEFAPPTARPGAARRRPRRARPLRPRAVERLAGCGRQRARDGALPGAGSKQLLLAVRAAAASSSEDARERCERRRTLRGRVPRPAREALLRARARPASLAELRPGCSTSCGRGRRAARGRRRRARREVPDALRHGRREPADAAVFALLEKVAPSDVSRARSTARRARARSWSRSALHELRPAQGQALPGRELRRRAGRPARERALRPQARLVHRRRSPIARGTSSPPTAARCSSTRSATCRSRCRPSSCASCRRAKCARSARTRSTQRRRARVAATQQGPARDVPRGHVPRGPLLPPQRDHDHAAAAARARGRRAAPRALLLARGRRARWAAASRSAEPR